ncbi:hypothetical protein BG000_005292 [Podila horticola]|nr:hypothetical protein BG000_005292 [Podila horticola]
MPKRHRKGKDTDESKDSGEDVAMTESTAPEAERKNKRRSQLSESQNSDTDYSRGLTNDSDPESQDELKKLRKEKKSKKDRKDKKDKKERKVKKEKRRKKEPNTSNTSDNDDASQDASKMSLPTPPPTSSLLASSIQSLTSPSSSGVSGAATPVVAAIGSLTVSSCVKSTLPQTTIKIPAMLPRAVTASRMVPRQISRPTPSASTLRSTGTPIPLPQSLQREVPKVFRAKDIIAHHHQSRKEAKASSSSTLSTSTSTSGSTFKSNPISSAPQEITSDMLRKAEPIVVFPEGAHNGKHGEYLFGNYPHYYVKRASQQKRTRQDRRKKNQGENGEEGDEKKDQGEERGEKEKTKRQGDTATTTTTTASMAIRRIYPQEKITVAGVTTPSVLLPCTGYGHTHGHATITSVQELARHVDLRIEFLEPSWFYKKRVLDIGCNSALLTVFIALHYQPRKIQGVDIDPSLIAKAQKFVRNTFSQLSFQAYTQKKTEATPSSHFSSSSSSGHTSGPTVPYEAYFPKSMSYLHGLLSVPPKTADTELLFPHNIEFRIADWMTSEPEHPKQQESEEAIWDVIIGFSLTKWIHLHHGDKGLQEFFHKVYRSLAPGGVFLVEPQAFVTYSKRSKITPTMRENYLAIKLKPEKFEEYLLQTVGFKESKLLGHSEGAAKNFNRDIYMFRK